MTAAVCHLTALAEQNGFPRRSPADCQKKSARSGRFLLTVQRCVAARMLPTRANGLPAFGQYRPDGRGGHDPWALQVIESSGGRIMGLNAFLDTAALFPLFGLPDHLPA